MSREATSMSGFWRTQLTTFAVLFAGYASYTYNRKSVSFALPNLMKNGLLDKSAAGTISSSQNTAYAISKFLGGVLSDKISAKWLFFSGLVLSGGATVLFSTSSSLTMFAALWFLNGFAQGAGWPACAKLLKKWFSPEQFGTFWSALSASSNVSGSLCPFLATSIIAQFDWRASLLVSGGVTLTSAICVALMLRDSPIEAGFNKDFSQEATKKKTDGKSTAHRLTWKNLIQSPFLWLVSAVYLVVFAAKTSVTEWGQLYLIEDLGHSAFTGSGFISAVETGGFFGGIAAGYVTDWLKKKWGKKTPGNPRMFAAIWFMAGVAGFLFVLTTFVTTYTSQFFLTVIGFGLGACLYACIAIYGIVASESYPSHLSGTAHAVVALAANVGAILSGLPCSYVAQLYNWRAIFIVLEVLAAAAALFLIVFRKVTPGLPEDKPKSQ
ncbi:glucose-6-phosphate exchanger SLC37A4-like [Daphnia carinata]|uniref:glucose-6-phosphate exchanger SLC37A4-like n=1 Tax=Daphnia carinata TaxID=120202 RepID=UPI00257FD23E|nr:glucose-6-phosphate exchanger SLC37A4-like [Daphnia carinata]XP_057373555.1 glucose-6-phosphate exchanger SLC37A4-like [Daphnia carinata]